ncbi:hypothetical protein ABZV34_35405 [Streptomyces sp. NPDC005195]|uniref:hypothetical protein n=1 Tax=Streptomyces sp. NPDC005195 TaxID=3154561 RepID=UPI0033A92149
MASCTTLARRLQGSPTTWSYGRYSVFWKSSDGDIEADVLGFGQATDGCYNEVAGQWRGDESGMATAQIPSTDKDEIRVAGAMDKAVTAAWKTRVAEGNGVDPSAADDDINLGFDPAEKAAYVWIQDTYGGLIGRAQRDNFQDVARNSEAITSNESFSKARMFRRTRARCCLNSTGSNRIGRPRRGRPGDAGAEGDPDAELARGRLGDLLRPDAVQAELHAAVLERGQAAPGTVPSDVQGQRPEHRDHLVQFLRAAVLAAARVWPGRGGAPDTPRTRSSALRCRT